VLAFGGDVPFGGSHPCIRPTIPRQPLAANEKQSNQWTLKTL